MKKRKAVVFMAVMAAALLFLSACGGGGGGEELTSTEPEAATNAVENFETAVQEGDANSLTDNISEKGVTANISGTEKTYQKSEAQELINEIKASTDTQIFNIINRNTTENSTEEGEEMVISGELVEAASPFSDNYGEANAAAASENVIVQYDADNFIIETPDNWIEDSMSLDSLSLEAFSAYSKIKDEAFAVLYFANSEVDDSNFYEGADAVVNEMENLDSELAELGIYNFKINSTERTKINGHQALKIEDTFEAEYELYKLVLEFRVIDGEYYLVNIRVEPASAAGDLMSRKETVYLVNADGRMVILDYTATNTSYNNNNLQEIVNSFKIK